uniref:KIB1-4 beta-propeller domain-containing protein n=1 Tax=Setaria italica TaxID=4555 RepID=K3Y2M3_SETIT
CFEIGQISQMACWTPSFRCWARSATSLHLQPPATRGALPSLLTHPNLPCTHSSHLFFSSLMSFLLPSPFAFRGASFGHMIFSSNRSCFLFDVFTGIDVSAPPLPIDEIYYSAALTAPLASPNSHLIVSTGSSNFFWRVGSNSWLKRSPRNGTLAKFVVFKGQLQKIPVSWGEKNSMTKWHLSTPWLVACGDMLLMVGCQSYYPGTSDVFEAYRLDTSTEPAKWMKVEKLENWVIFISNDEGVQPLSCMNPERWGGRSNCVYCYDSGRWVAFEFGKSTPLLGDATKPDVRICICCVSMVQPIWVIPSMFSLCCDG